MKVIKVSGGFFAFFLLAGNSFAQNIVTYNNPYGGQHQLVCSKPYQCTTTPVNPAPPPVNTNPYYGYPYPYTGYIAGYNTDYHYTHLGHGHLRHQAGSGQRPIHHRGGGVRAGGGRGGGRR